MNSKLKRIVAREGLVILGCLTFSIVLSFLSIKITAEEPTYLYRCLTGGHVYEIEMNKYVWPTTDEERFNFYDAVRKLYPNDFKVELKNPKITFLPDDLEIKYIGAQYTLKGKLINLFTFISTLSYFFYLIYLLTRFIVWAIRTLKQKEKVN